MREERKLREAGRVVGRDPSIQQDFKRCLESSCSTPMLRQTDAKARKGANAKKERNRGLPQWAKTARKAFKQLQRRRDDNREGSQCIVRQEAREHEETKEEARFLVFFLHLSRRYL
jgi:hypothetical protein